MLGPSTLHETTTGGWEEGPSNQDLMQEALIVRSYGWSVIPLTSKKTPCVRWGRYKHERPTDLQICKMFALDGVGGLGVSLEA
jgi:hypothetical protein